MLNIVEYILIKRLLLEKSVYEDENLQPASQKARLASILLEQMEGEGVGRGFGDRRGACSVIKPAFLHC